MVIETAQARAARATLDLLVREAAFARRGKGGGIIEKVPITTACFQHGESRPAEHADCRIFADPNLHTHCVIMNIACRGDGTVGALHSKILRDWNMASGATDHAALAPELQALGFGIDRIGKNGIFELAGVEDDAIRYFSARRKEIEAEPDAAGTTSAEAVALAAAVTRATRSAKGQETVQSREAIWREAAAQVGLTPDGFVPHLHGHVCPVQENAERALEEQLASLPRKLTEHDSVIDRRELVRCVTGALVGTGLPAGRAKIEVERLVSSGAIVEIGRDAIGLPRYSTREMIEIEHDIVRLAGELERQASRRFHRTPIRGEHGR